jgi:hypothetical protein
MTQPLNTKRLMKAYPRLREALLDLLWQQWAALGMAGATKAGAEWCVDPEALVLITTTQGRADPRLFNEMLDWLWVHGESVNVQRLKNIQKAVGLGDRRVLGAIAAWLSQRSTLSKWKPLAAISKPVAKAESLFISKDGTPQPSFGQADPIFLKHGFHRGPIKRRELSQAPNPLLPATLLWKLRALFGVQARAEILLWLLTHESGHAADIARGTFYFPRTVDETLKELAASGMVKSARAGREKRYWLKPGEWSFLQTWNRPDGFPRWIDWARFFTVQERIGAVLSNRELSPMLQASELRRVFDELHPVLTDGGLLPAFAASRNDTGLAFTDALLEDLRAWLAQL